MAKRIIVASVEGPNGKPTHPLIDARLRFGLPAVAKAVGHNNHSTVSLYCARAAKSKNLLVPPNWVLPLCKLTGRRPAEYRPDLYQPEWSL